MSAVAIFLRTALVAALAVPGATLLTSVTASDAQAQFSVGFGGFGGGFGGSRQGRGGGSSGGGGGHGSGGDGGRRADPCLYGNCVQQRPRVVVVPEYAPRPYYEQEYYYPEEAPPSGQRPAKKVKKKEPVKQAKPKKTQPEKAAASPQLANKDFRPDEVLVEVPLSVSESDVDALAAQQKIEKLGSTEIALLNTRIYRWRITDGRSPETVVAAISADSRVAGAHFNRVFALQQSLTSDGPPQYAAEKLKLTDVHALTRGENVLVALIDSGADGTHPELNGVIAQSFDAVGGENKPGVHGTGMAGAIAGQALLNGVAPKAHILDVRAFAANGKTSDGTTFDVVRGMDWAAQQGAQVFNLSFAGPQDPLMSRVIKAAIDKGIIVVAAAGNAGPKSPPLFPGAEPGVIAVTATDADNGAMPAANRGDYLAVAAPGVDILLPAPQKTYAVSSGTSISTAYVSGMVALMLSRNPQASAKEIAEVLSGTAEDLGPKGRDKDFGAGLVNPVAALEAMEPAAQTVSAPQSETPAELAPALADQPVR
jgi:subtilisin family serine protease